MDVSCILKDWALDSTHDHPTIWAARPRHELWIWDLQASVKSPSSDPTSPLLFCKGGVNPQLLPHRIMDVNFGE